jgi:hypothetical protein
MIELTKSQRQPETPEETVEARFRRLEKKCMGEVGHWSSSTVIRNHPALREIIGMGEAVVPLMLRDLEERPRLWVWALPQITGVGPGPDRDKVAKMSDAWLRCGRAKGYRW